MIDLDTAARPKGRKVPIALVDLTLRCAPHSLDLSSNVHKRFDFLAFP